jgi:hypothetical protein
MDRARKRFQTNVEKLTAHNPELAVMGDRDWTASCGHPFIERMAKKLWLFDYSERDIEQIEKAVTGFLSIQRQRAEAEPVRPGGQVVKGRIMSVKQACDSHGDCPHHWYMNVKSEEARHILYTPIPVEYAEQGPHELIGDTISFYAYVTVSERDETFGFAHRPKLMTITKREKQNAR